MEHVLQQEETVQRSGPNCGSCTEGQMEVWFCKVCKEVANTNITLQLTCAERTQHSPAAGMEQSNHQSGSLRMSVRKGSV